MDINEKIEEKKQQLAQAEQQINQLTQFAIGVQGGIAALYEIVDADKEAEVTEGFSDESK
jgi:hypothetical protein